ncbi:MAG: hypothetical protein LBF19_06450 [Prevotellaceae bacterium]|jgi:hypothetical protein|nr:hypothetical protein [Prevotellaceae bacterium]
MKKIIYTAVILLGSIGYLQAQPFRLGFDAGGGVSSLLMPNPSLTPFLTYRAGVFVAQLDSSGEYSEYGIAYRKAGARTTGLLEHYAGAARNIELNIHYIDVYHDWGVVRNTMTLFKTKASFIHKSGFYVGYAFGGDGRIAYDTGAGALLEKEIGNIFQDETFSHAGETYPFTGFKRWDYGLRFGTDILINQFSIRLHTMWGLRNLHSGGLDKWVLNAALTVSVGYIL